MTTRGQVNSNFYQIVNVDSDGNPTSVKGEYVPVANTVADNSQPNITSTGTLTGLTSTGVVNFNGTSNVTLGNVSNLHISGGVSGYVLQTNGSGLLSWVEQTGGGGNGVPGGANTQVQYNNAGAFAGSANFVFNNTSNTLTVTNIVANGSQLTSLTGANVTGTVANANYATTAGTAYSVSVANVSGIGNIATINLDGNVSNILHGNGYWGPETQTGNANYAAYAGNVTIAAQPNITSLGNLLNLQFSNTVTPIASPNIGQMFWDTGEHTVTLGMENGVKQQIGLESYIYVKASSAITNGQVVMFTGATGDNVQAAPANVAVAGFRAGYVLGVATQDIANNGFGYITSFGQVHGLNTNSYNVGDLLWLNPAVVGGMTATQPSAPNYQIQIATVTKKSGGDGHIQVIIRPEPQLKDISDVTITSPTVGQALVFDGGNVWINGTPNLATYATVVTSSSQPNITSTGTLTTLNVSATVNATSFSSNVTTGTAPFTVLSTTQVANLNSATAGTVTTNAQPNITSTGTLTSLDITGNLTSGNANLGNLASANYFSGNGSLLTGVIATATPAGSNTEVQYNNAGVLGATSGFTFTGTTSQPSITLYGSTGGTIARKAAINLSTTSGNGNIIRSHISNAMIISDANAITLTATNINLGSNSNVKITGGSSSQALTTDGAGNLSWTTVAAVAGSNTYVQFNDDGVMNGNPSLAFYKSNSVTYAQYVNSDAVVATGNVNSGNINVGGIANVVGNANFGNISTTGSANIVGNASVGNISSAGLSNIANTVFTKFNETVVNGGSVSGTITPNAAAGTIYQYGLVGNITLNTIGNMVAGTSMTIILLQDATGGRTLTSSMKFAGGSKTLSTAANATDIISVFYDGATLYAVLTKGYA